MYPALIRKNFVAFLIFSLFFLIGSFFITEKAISQSGTITFSNPNPNGESFSSGTPITFSIDITDSYTGPGTRYVTLYIDGAMKETQTYDPPYIPFSFTGSSLNSYTPLSGSHTWYVRVSDVTNTLGINSGTYTFSVTPAGPDLDNNITFSNLSPTSGTYDNPVIFDGVITDNEPTPGVRTVEINIDGAPAWTTTYVSGGISGPVPLNIASPPTTHNWYVKVSLGSSSTRYPRFTTYTISVNPPSTTPNAPTSLAAFCPDSGSGFIDGSGLKWCNKNSPYEYGAYYNTKDEGEATFSVRDPRGTLFTNVSPSGPNTNRGGTVGATPSYILLEGTYTWETWSSGTGWESNHATDNFGVDTTGPNVGPGTPFLNQQGSNWVVNWISNGSDALSGIHEVRLIVYDNGSSCSWISYGPTETQGGFNCWDPLTGGNTTFPLPGHTYTFEVITCDYAGNCIPTPSTGSYDGGVTPTYTISGNVFVDTNGNGTKDWLTDTDYQGASIWFNGGPGTTTDWSGNYSFTDLPAGTYTIELIVPSGYMLTTPPAFRSLAISSDSPNNNFGIRYNGGPTPTPTPVPPSYPTVQSLKVNLSDAGQVAQVNGITFSGIYGFSGNQTGSDSGVKWLNPINVTLNARRGNLNFPIYQYYVAFYDKGSGSKLTTKSSFLSSVKTRLSNPANGFLLAYGNEFYITGGGSAFTYKYYIWNKTGWQNITSSSFTVKDASNNNLFTATKIANGFLSPNYYVTWKIDFDKNFGSKPMYTAVYVVDQLGQSDFNSSIIPNP